MRWLAAPHGVDPETAHPETARKWRRRASAADAPERVTRDPTRDTVGPNS